MRTEVDAYRITQLPIGLRVRTLRGRREISQALLAGLLGRSTSWLQKVESGRRSLDSVELIYQLADLLGADPQILLARPAREHRTEIHVDPPRPRTAMRSRTEGPHGMGAAARRQARRPLIDVSRTLRRGY